MIRLFLVTELANDPLRELVDLALVLVKDEVG